MDWASTIWAIPLENQKRLSDLSRGMKMGQEGLSVRQKRPYYLWDYNISFDEFQQLLDGSKVFGRLDRDWAAVRLIEYAPYEEMIRLVGYPALVREWPTWRKRVRMKEIKRGLDFLVTWLPQTHPELLEDKPTKNKEIAKNG